MHPQQHPEIVAIIEEGEDRPTEILTREPLDANISKYKDVILIEYAACYHIII